MQKPRRRPEPRELEVIAKRAVTPNMLRVTLGGDGMQGFPDDQDGAYVKLRVPALDPDADGDTAVRTYTVRHYRRADAEIDVDFVLHDVQGPAAQWAGNCGPGDTLKVGGPGAKKTADHGSDWFLFAGDMSALPAISANLEVLPPGASGVAFLEIIDEADRQPLSCPAGVTIEWLVNAHPEHANSVLLDAVTACPIPATDPYFWVAGEFSQSLAIRAYLRTEHAATRDRMYASSYWQIGQTEDGHRVSKAAARDE